MLEKGIIERASGAREQVISPIFARGKKDGSVRIILDLSLLNKFIVYRHLKMDTFAHALTLITKNCFMASVDRKDAYYCVSIATDDRKYLRFR